jgi:hypothetical protein
MRIPSETFIKRICFLFFISIGFFSAFAQAQDNSANMSLSDEKKFKKAMQDTKEIEPDEIEKLQPINVFEIRISVVTVIENICDDYKKAENVNTFSEKTVWISLASEIKSTIQKKKGEFVNKENRLKKLLGLRPDRTYRCVIELEVNAEKINRPSSLFNLHGDLLKPINSKIKNEDYDDKYPFTNLGYACDWYYGDGCRFGVTEFIIKKGNKSLIKKACTIDEYVDEKC